jgi:DNA-directed RNA polymerase
MYEKHGVKDFSMIHDSFATHAGNNRLMFEVTKDTFQEFYKGKNWLEDLYTNFKKQGVPMLRYKRDSNGKKIKKRVKTLFGGSEVQFVTEPIPLSEIRELGDYDFEDFKKLEYFFH